MSSSSTYASLLVRPKVLVQVIRSHKLLTALRALEPLLPRVRPPVPLQLIGPGEPLAAVHPVADKGSLSWNSKPH